MGGFRSNTASAIIAASVLAYQTTGAHASQHLRHHRSLQTNDDSVSSGDYEHVGCFKDSRHDRILGAKLTNDEVNAEFCYKYCNDLGAPLMATQWGKECWCATHVEVDFGRHGEAVCDFPCAGNKDGEDEMCGGFDALDLYIIGSHSSSEDDDDAEDTASPTGSPTASPTATPTSPALPSEPETIPEDDAMEDDIVKIIPVTGANPVKSWADSYSVGDTCYMHSNLDHGIADKVVDTPLGSMTISELYALMGSGPGPDGHPLYNDIQCGNGPPNDWADETQCPGLVEHGPEGCGQIGPMWDLSELSKAEEDEVAEDTSTPAAPSSPPPPSAPKTSPPEGAMEDDIVKIIEVTGNHAPGHWADSYSVGDSCWIYSNFDHGVADFIVETPIGSMTISELYVLMGPGPGHEGRPLYNDIQCGNGPPNSMADETQCPGLLDHGPEGCGQIGPKWNLSEL